MKNETIKKINKSPHKVFVTATGGGSQWVGNFLRFGGGSNTLIGFYVPYATGMVNDFIGSRPIDNKYVSDKTARLLACESYNKVKPIEKQYGVGIGLSASLMKTENERPERTNKAFIAVQTYDMLWCFELIFNKEVACSRTIQEDVLEVYITFIIETISEGKNFPYNKGWFPLMDTGLLQELECEEFSNTIGGVGMVKPYHEYTIRENINWMAKNMNVVFPGSFNPIHDCHIKMADKVEELTGKKPIFELSVLNYEKPPLDAKDISDRVWDISNAGFRSLVTMAPMIRDKASCYPNSIFMIGMDTYNRINWFSDSKIIDKHNTQFIVFPRNGQTFKSSKENAGSHIHPATFELQDWNCNMCSTDIRTSLK